MRPMPLRCTVIRCALLISTFVAPLALAAPLSVCLAENNPPLSYLTEGRVLRGLDVRVAEAVAAELGRPLKLVPFESKYEGDSSLASEVNALLSSGVCELASGFPLLAPDIGPAQRPTARVPDHPGAPPPSKRPWVPLGTLEASRPYHTAALALVVRDPARSAATLAEPGDARIGATAGTLTGTIVSLYRNGRLKKQVFGLAQNEDALEQLEAGRIDATLVPLDRLDAWRIRHPGSVLHRTGYLHPLRINIGFVALHAARDELDAANKVIVRAGSDGTLERWSRDLQTSWIPPVAPDVGTPIGLSQLRE